MSDFDDFAEEEMHIMEERKEEEAHHALSSGIDIEDPIKTLNIFPVISANQDLTLKETIDILLSRNVGCVSVTDSNENTVGIFTERDLLRRVIGKGVDVSAALLKDYMTPDPEVLSEDDPISYALNRMSDGSYRHIPITHKGKVKYMLSIKDIVDHVSFTYRKSVLNLPPKLDQAPSADVGG